MRLHTLRATAIAAALFATGLHALAATTPAAKEEQESSSVPAIAEPQLKAMQTAAQMAIDSLGLQLWGYMRSGFYAGLDGAPKAQYQLGGSLQHYRLGNEGDNYVEFGIGKKIDLGGGVKWGTYFMPTVYNGSTGTAQVYTDISGLSFFPNLTLWAGQRYHRIQDVHILDNWVMEDGDNYGAGVDGIKVGGGTLNLAVYTDGSAGNNDSKDSTNRGKRANFQLRDMPVNPGGTLNVTGAVIRGDYAHGSDGYALGLLHNQKDFLIAGNTNSLFIQHSTGHASINGKFNDDATTPGGLNGAKHSRIVESMNWQVGRFGGQAVIGYETLAPDDNSPKVKDWSLGGRGTYGVAKNVKLVGEVGLNRRKIDGQDVQNLAKETVAVAFAPNTDFWTRPEVRMYVTHANWNDAAGLANATSFGANGRSNANTVGVQVEAWW